MAQYRAKLEVNLAEWRAQFESEQEIFRSVGKTGVEVIKWLILANGAGAIAMLAFLGAILSAGFGAEDQASRAWLLNFTTVIKAATGVFALFAAGAGLGISASGFGYFAQWAYREASSNRGGNFLRVIGTSLGVAGVVCFFLGIYLAYSAFLPPLIPSPIPTVPLPPG